MLSIGEQNVNELITQSGSFCWKVTEGTVTVYLIVGDGKNYSRRYYVCKRNAGEVMPDLFFTDSYGFMYSLLLSSEKNAILAEDYNCDYKKVAEGLCGHFIPDTIQGNYEERISAYHRIKRNEEISYINSTAQNRMEAKEKTQSAIGNAFRHSRRDNRPEKNIFQDNYTWPEVLHYGYYCIEAKYKWLWFALLAVVAVSGFFGTSGINTAALFVLLVALFSLDFLNKFIEHDVQKCYSDAFVKRAFSMKEKYLEATNGTYFASDVLSNAKKAAEDISGLSETMIFGILFFVGVVVLLSEGTASLIIIFCVAAIVDIIIFLFFEKSKESKRRKLSESSRFEQARLYQFINQISEIRMNGAEEQAEYEYIKAHISTEKLREYIKQNILVKYAFQWIITGCFYFAVISCANYGFYSFLEILLAESICWLSFNMIMNRMAVLISHIKHVSGIFLSENTEQIRHKGWIPALKGNITIENLSFSYGNMVIFKDFNLKINAGEYIGIVGASGSGKSTLIKLLLGFEEPEHGKIQYEGCDTGDLDIKKLRANIGVVIQDGRLISGSILENLCLMQRDVSKEKISKILREVDLFDDIENMPMGLNTIVSEYSDVISKGQKQRLLLARALLNDPKILLLDEATNSLDAHSQKKILEAIKRRNITRIVISHRMELLDDCDRIYKIKKTCN